MSNLINFFFSFDKLMKEKLVIAFFWLALIVAGLKYISTALSTVRLGPLASVIDFIIFFGSILLTLVSLRLACELAVALFRINDNLSPDGGKSETANIDPIVEARKAAEAAAHRARDLTKTAGEKASAASRSVRDSAEDLADSAAAKAKSARTPKKRGRPAGSTNKPKASTAKKPAAKLTGAPKKRGRPAGSKNKGSKNKTAKAKTPKAKRASTGKRKPGPRPGTKAKRDAQGRLLKKDGTLRGKPGPKKK